MYRLAYPGSGMLTPSVPPPPPPPRQMGSYVAVGTSYVWPVPASAVPGVHASALERERCKGRVLLFQLEADRAAADGA